MIRHTNILRVAVFPYLWLSYNLCWDLLSLPFSSGFTNFFLFLLLSGFTKYSRGPRLLDYIECMGDLLRSFFRQPLCISPMYLGVDSPPLCFVFFDVWLDTCKHKRICPRCLKILKMEKTFGKFNMAFLYFMLILWRVWHSDTKRTQENKWKTRNFITGCSKICKIDILNFCLLSYFCYQMELGRNFLSETRKFNNYE